VEIIEHIPHDSCHHDEINQCVKNNVSETLGYNSDDIVSSDIIGETHGSIFDPKLTMMIDVNGKKMYKLFT
jgi:glyceraldehyde 3-phosphate dehydrogenase